MRPCALCVHVRCQTVNLGVVLHTVCVLTASFKDTDGRTVVWLPFLIQSL